MSTKDKFFEKIYEWSEKYDKYRPWLWLVCFLCFLITSWWGTNTESTWILIPFTIGSVTLFFGLKGEYVILSFADDEPLMFMGIGMFYSMVYVLVGAMIMAIASGFASLIN